MSKTKSKKILELFYELGEKMDVKIVNAKEIFKVDIAKLMIKDTL